MQMPHCLFLIEDQHQCQVEAIHIQGTSNKLVDNLPRSNVNLFHIKSKTANLHPLYVCSFFPCTVATTQTHSELNFTGLDPGVQYIYFCLKGLADSTYEAYQSDSCHFVLKRHPIIPISCVSVSEVYSLVLLSGRPAIIITDYQDLPSWHLPHPNQILLGLPEPREFSLLPYLHLVQPGIQQSNHKSLQLPIRYTF